ncbi:pr domain zinc finger protein [Holotrichia oblita]|uniref:Pr domain zinc finger protein n=1 Tax=Holotrichia oblita TaxID=644536 RepID=A0ACB9TXE6_HOLOL|nr:pr domain zinc finger protein [Holotrichia oblita]
MSNKKNEVLFLQPVIPEEGRRNHFKPFPIELIKEEVLLTTDNDTEIVDNDPLGANNLLCIVCQEDYATPSNLIAHQKLFHTVPTTNIQLENQCHVCRKTYCSSSALRHHMRIHEKDITKAKPYFCEKCGQRFSQKCSLISHYIIHTGDRPFKCRYCQNAFPRKDSVVRHEQIHTDEKPFGCKICGRHFRRKSHLNCHMKTH